MEIRQRAERLNSVPVRKKAKRLLALTMAVLMVNPVTGYGVSAHAQEAETITAFAKLSSEIATQQLVVGAEESDINLPDTLSVTLSVYGVDTAEKVVEDSQPEEIPAEEAKVDESTSEDPAADEAPADASAVSDNNAAEPQEAANPAEDNTATDSEATVVLDSGEVPLAASTSEERTLTGTTWQINAERSGSDTFDSESAGAVFFYEPVLPEGYTLADGVSLPQIQVKIEDSDKWVFSQSQTIDGIEIAVKAEKDVFPEGAVLHAEKVTSTEDKEKIQSAVSEEVKAENSAKTVTKMVSFDITITDADGNELQPDTGKGEVKVTFAQMPMVTEYTAATQELKVFHMDDSLSEAKGLETTVNQEEGTLEAPAEHFSVFSVMLLTSGAEDDVAIVTVPGNDPVSYTDFGTALSMAQSNSGSTLTLLGDVDRGDQTIMVASGKTMTIDTNGHTLSFYLGENEKGISVEEGATFTLRGNSSESATVRGIPAMKSTTKSWGYWTILIYSKGTCTIESAYIEGNEGASRGVVMDGGSLSVKNSTIKGGSFSIYNRSGEVYFDALTTLEGQLSLKGRATINSGAFMTSNNGWLGYFNSFCVNGTIGGNFTWNPNMRADSKLITTEFTADNIEITDSNINPFPIVYTGNAIETKVNMATKTISDSDGVAKEVTIDTSSYPQTFEKQGIDSNWSEVTEVKDAGTYRVKYVSGDKTITKEFTVGKKALTIKADDKLNVVKGAAMPELTYIVNGLVDSDTFTSPTISTTATDTNTVGEYDITISGGTLANADSYAVTYTNGKLTVVNATYTVTVTNGTDSGSYSEGQTVTITAESRSGYTFTGWSSSDSVTFANSTASTTTFTMPDKAVTVTANYSKNSSGDGGGSSGGGSSSSGSGAPTTTTPEKMPNQPVTAAAPVTATAGKNGAASASIPDKAVTDAIVKAQADAINQGKTANGISVELNVTMPKGTASLTATLTRSSLDSLVSAGVSSLEIGGSLVTVSFDKKALAEIQKQSTGNINIAIAPKTNLSNAAKKIIGTRPVYDITVGYGSGKTVSSFGGGIATVSIPYTLGKNEAVGGLYAVYVDAKGNATRIAGSAYDANSGCVIFTTTHFSQYGIGYTAPTAKFTDISTHWAKESIDYVVGRGLLSGSSETAFSPNSAMTRGMLVTALGRLAGVDTKAYTKNSFTDVKADSAYRPYIEWAYSKSIIQGIGNSQFAPDRAITREEIAVIFANYAKATGYTLPITREASVYADASSIGSAYRDAVKAMQQAGIMMGGSDNKFNPKGNATRAEVSSMLGRYIKLTINPATAQGWAQNDAGQYLYYKDGKALTGTQTIDGVKYFFNTDGTLKTGWVKDGDNWRFYSGKTMLVGFWDLGVNGNNKTYYFTKDGLMISGKWLEIDGKWYYFYTDGSLARSTKIDGYEVDKNGVRKTK